MIIVSKIPFKLKNGTETLQWLSWNELQEQINFLNNVFGFTRIIQIQEKYDKYLKTTANLESNVLHKKIMEKNLKINNKSSFGIEEQFVFRKNNYPYDFGKNEHYLLWIHPKCSNEIKEKIFTQHGINDIIDDLLLKYDAFLDHLQRKERLLFRNAPINKSVLSIEHFHVIFKME